MLRGESISYQFFSFTLDPAGRVQRKQDQKGDTCTLLYDLAGRLTQRDYRLAANSPTGTIADSDTFTYDRAGRMLTAVSGRYSNTVTYTYDTAGRKKTESLTISGQTYTTTSGYNARGELTSLTYPDSTVVDREYTDRGELYRLKHASTVIDTRGYDDGGRMTSSSYNNGVSESRAYNAGNTLASIAFSGASIGNLSYGWDSNKNKTSESIGGTMSGYGFSVGSSGYDNEDRLVNYNRTDGNLDQSWSLSSVGDWNSVTTEGSTQSRTHGPTHELLTGGGQNVSTDVKGSITLIPSSLRPTASSLLLNWDFDNRLSTADVGNNSSVDVTYKFDALGRRVYRQSTSSTTVYIQSGQQTIADYVAGTAASSPTYRYVYASYIDEPVYRYKPTGSESIYYHRNQQYSIIALTSGSGTIVERYAYSAYGSPTITDSSGTTRSDSAYGNRYTYTGREWDADIVLYHYRARLYDPTLGRFCSRDPIGYVDGYNGYGFYLGLADTDSTGQGLDSVSRAMFECMKRPTIEEQIACLETLSADARAVEAIRKLKQKLPKQPQIDAPNPRPQNPVPRRPIGGQQRQDPAACLAACYVHTGFCWMTAIADLPDFPINAKCWKGIGRCGACSQKCAQNCGKNGPAGGDLGWPWPSRGDPDPLVAWTRCDYWNWPEP